MSLIDQLHPRGHHLNRGGFSEKIQSAPETTFDQPQSRELLPSWHAQPPVQTLISEDGRTQTQIRFDCDALITFSYDAETEEFVDDIEEWSPGTFLWPYSYWQTKELRKYGQARHLENVAAVNNVTAPPRP